MQFRKQAMRRMLVSDRFYTMQSVNGSSLAVPPPGEDWQAVILGSDQISPCHPDAPVVPRLSCLRYTGFDRFGWIGVLFPGLDVVADWFFA